MPRMARQKREGAIYHIMARSISEVGLFKTDSDKKKYMDIIKEYQIVYSFKIYAYCLMDTHLHIIIDSNGADISKIMHCVNFKYAQYFNYRHQRHGHLFQDRFNSKIVGDSAYLKILSAYIHNNPTDISGYEKKPEKYLYSSLAIYLGLRKDPFEIVDEKFVLSLFGRNIETSRKRYSRLVYKTKLTNVDNLTKEDTEFENEKSEYRSERKILIRDFNIDKVIQFVIKRFKINKIMLCLKYQKKYRSVRAILVLLLRNLCNLSCKDICAILGNITASSVSKLCSLGVVLISHDENHKKIVCDFMEEYGI